jgi:hypothetical protein
MTDGMPPYEQLITYELYKSTSDEESWKALSEQYRHDFQRRRWADTEIMDLMASLTYGGFSYQCSLQHDMPFMAFHLLL